MVDSLPNSDSPLRLNYDMFLKISLLQEIQKISSKQAKKKSLLIIS